MNVCKCMHVPNRSQWAANIPGLHRLYMPSKQAGKQASKQTNPRAEYLQCCLSLSDTGESRTRAKNTTKWARGGSAVPSRVTQYCSAPSQFSCDLSCFGRLLRTTPPSPDTLASLT